MSFKALGDSFFKHQRIVWDRDRELTGNKTIDVLQRMDTIVNESMGITKETYLTKYSNIPCHFRTPTLKEMTSGLYSFDSILVSYYDSPLPDLEDVISLEGVYYKIITFKERDRSGRIDLVVSRLET